MPASLQVFSASMVKDRGIEYIHSTGREISRGNMRSSNISQQELQSFFLQFGLVQLVSAIPSTYRIAKYRA